MKHFLSIVLRNSFNLFYRFGYTFIPKSQLVEFDGNINSEIQESIIKQFKTVAPFEYDEEYLILRLEKEIVSESDFIQFEIQDIISIYPLSQQAKASIESKIDQRIRLEKPIFETILPLIETEIENKEVEKAISALWKICKIESPLEKYIANIGLENILNGLEFRKHGTKANKIQSGNYWEYLIAYDYYQYFPEGTIRYFYQLGEVFSYFKGKTDGIEGTKIEDTLKQIGSGNFEQILQRFNQNSLPPSFIETMNEIGKSEFNPIIVSVLFLKWKADLSSQDIDILNSSVFHKGNIVFIDKFPTEVRLALILLGAFFGFRKFYDNYYEALNLRFYKDFKEPQKQTEKEEPQEPQEKVDTILETDNSVKTVTEEEQVKEKQTETKDEEIATETTSVEEPILDEKTEILSKEKQTEIIAEKQSDISNAQQDDNKEVISVITSQYIKIIEQELSHKPEVKLSDIAKTIKEKTGKELNVGDVEGVAKQMNGIDIFKIRGAKAIRISAKFFD
ncbi:hypothetical protein [uncultured Bacteroides sp.]|uniref:hypothetical protein n=1 Tax=uncultured Bacteroides sp. TaxID=162156 RepID=UPI002AA820C7|nr:hypothetical protein [uncultured Bacteroides sp.]